MGSAWRRLTVSSAVATRPCRTWSASQQPRPPAPTGWAWRGSPTIQICPPGQATAAASTTSASRLDSWENSSTITTQPGGNSSWTKAKRATAVAGIPTWRNWPTA